MRNRKIIRKQNYDYSSDGWYYVTICTKDRKCYFGEIINEVMHPNEIGKQANVFIQEISNHFPHVELGKFVVMPNHIHIILRIVGTQHVVSVQKTDVNVRTGHGATELKNDVTTLNNVAQLNQFGKTIPGSLSAIMGQLKSTLTRWCRANDYAHFAWQSRFHDHIIRTNESFERISEYIKNNPANWNNDKFHA
ncbi:MAG: transposase [Labilibaculum sp.]|nr:transposase [Labilibaculum sp.]